MLNGGLLAPVVVAVVAVGVFAPWVLRVVGGLLFLDGILTLWFHGWDVGAVDGLALRVGGGLALWAVGHLVHRVKYGAWRTRLAGAVFSLLTLRVLRRGRGTVARSLAHGARPVF